MTYNKLNIERSKISPLLSEFCGNTIADCNISSKLVRKGQEEQFTVSGICDGSKKEVKISFISNQEGTTTINYKMGKSQDISKRIADFICEKAIVDNRKYSISTLNAVKSEDLDLVIEYLQSDYDSFELLSTDIQHGIQKKVKIDTGENITFNYYNTGTLTITGRPLLFHNSALNYFTELKYLKPVHRFDSTVQYYQIQTKYSDFEQELINRLPNAYHHLPENIKALVLSGVILEKIEIDLPDYSSFAFNVLKSIEGLMKHLLFEKGINIERSFDIFKKDSEPVVLKTAISNTINCNKTNEVIQETYEFYKKERHTLFHTEYLDVSTRIVEKREDALEILNNALAVIDDAYNKILN
jgi:hypothetical protein